MYLYLHHGEEDSTVEWKGLVTSNHQKYNISCVTLEPVNEYIY